MKPWEETWHWDEARGKVMSDYEHPDHEWGDTIVITDSGCYPPFAGGRRDLLVQAPAMARLLAKIRQTYVPDGEAAREIEAVLDAAGARGALPDWCNAANAND